MKATFELEKEKLIQSFYDNSKLENASIDINSISIEAVNDADGNFSKLVLKFDVPDTLAQAVACKGPRKRRN